MSFASMLQGLTSHDVRFVVIGGVAAAAHGSAYVTNDLDICYDTAPDNAAVLAQLLASWNAYLREVEPGLPFVMDARALRTTPFMTLQTREGNLDVLDRVAGVGDYAAALAASEPITAFDTSFRILKLPALLAAKKAAGRAKDKERILELEALLALRRKRGKRGEMT